VAIPPLACLVALPFARWRESRTLRHGLGALLLLLLSLPMVWTIMLGSILKRDEQRSESAPEGLVHCLSPAYFAPLAALPPGMVAASSNLGAHLLRFTGHRVLAAPYHRNQAGLLAQLEIAQAPPAEAEELLRAAGIDYLALCLEDPEYSGGAPGGAEARLFFALQAGESFAFLDSVAAAPDSPLRFYRLSKP
jgi:hypothetical protein